MKIDKNGKLDIGDRESLEILEEFGWNIQTLVGVIKELSYEIDVKDKKISELKESLKNEIQ